MQPPLHKIDKGAEFSGMPYAVHYESYGSSARESIDTPGDARPTEPGKQALRCLWLCALAAGLVLRVWMLKLLFEVNGDSLIYGGMAKNLLLHGRFALTLPSGEMYPTLIRLPGYPLFLAACFRLFGMENYFAAACVQIASGIAGLPAAGRFCAPDCSASD